MDPNRVTADSDIFTVFTVKITRYLLVRQKNLVPHFAKALLTAKKMKWDGKKIWGKMLE